MTQNRFAFLVFSLSASLVSGAAAAAPMVTTPPKIESSALQDVKMALGLPLGNRLDTLKRKGSAVIDDLEAVAFSPKESLETRWRALTSAGRLYPKAAQPVLERALNSQDWYMRNAAMIVVPYGDRDWAVKWSKIMMHDQALVVRTAAVESIRKLHAVEAEDLLWEKLYSTENYNRGKSLWIRKRIAETLVSFAHPGQEKSFSKLLKDQDPAMHGLAAQGLNRVSNRELTRDQWLKTVQ